MNGKMNRGLINDSVYSSCPNVVSANLEETESYSYNCNTGHQTMNNFSNWNNNSINNSLLTGPQRKASMPRRERQLSSSYSGKLFFAFLFSKFHSF